MADSCQYEPCNPNNDGKKIKLWDDLKSYFNKEYPNDSGKARDEEIKYWDLAHNQKFLNTTSDILAFDDQGNPTIDTLLYATNTNMANEQATRILEVLNSEYEGKQYTLDSALDIVEKFNKQRQDSKVLCAAIIEPQSHNPYVWGNGFKISIVKKSSDEVDKCIQNIAAIRMIKEFYELCKKYGINLDISLGYELNVKYGLYSSQINNGIFAIFDLTLFQPMSDLNKDSEFIGYMEKVAGNAILVLFHNRELILRFWNALQNYDVAKTIADKYDIKIGDRMNPQYAQLAARLLGMALHGKLAAVSTQSNERSNAVVNLARRAGMYIKRLFDKLRGKVSLLEIQQRTEEIENEMREIIEGVEKTEKTTNTLGDNVNQNKDDPQSENYIDTPENAKEWINTEVLRDEEVARDLVASIFSAIGDGASVLGKAIRKVLEGVNLQNTTKETLQKIGNWFASLITYAKKNLNNKNIKPVEAEQTRSLLQAMRDLCSWIWHRLNMTNVTKATWKGYRTGKAILTSAMYSNASSVIDMHQQILRQIDKLYKFVADVQPGDELEQALGELLEIGERQTDTVLSMNTKELANEYTVQFVQDILKQVRKIVTTNTKTMSSDSLLYKNLQQVQMGMEQPSVMKQVADYAIILRTVRETVKTIEMMKTIVGNNITERRRTREHWTTSVQEKINSFYENWKDFVGDVAKLETELQSLEQLHFINMLCLISGTDKIVFKIGLMGKRQRGMIQAYLSEKEKEGWTYVHHENGTQIKGMTIKSGLFHRFFRTKLTVLQKETYGYTEYITITDNGLILNMNKQSVELSFETLVQQLDADATWWSGWFGSMSNSDKINTTIDKAYKQLRYQADQKTILAMQQLLYLQKRLNTMGMYSRQLYERDDEGHLTGNIISKYNRGKFEQDLNKFKDEQWKEFEKQKSDLVAKWHNGTLSYVGISAAWEDFFNDKYKRWCKKHMHKEINPHTQKKTYVPNDTYLNKDYERLCQDHIYSHFDSETGEMITDESLELWLKDYHTLKAEMDICLPEHSTSLYRAPQFRAKFFSEVKNRAIYDGIFANGTPIGGALRTKLNDTFFDDPTMVEFGDDNTSYETTPFPESQNLYESGNEIADRLPRYGIRKLKDMSTLSTDIFLSTLQYASMAYTYGALDGLVHSLEVGRQVLLKRKLPGKNITEEMAHQQGYMSRSFRRFTKFMDRQIYGLDHTFDKVTTFNKIAIKTIKSMQHGATITLLGSNLRGGIVNTNTGVLEIFKEGLAAQYFDTGDVLWANNYYIRHMLTTYTGVTGEFGIIEGGAGSNVKIDFLSSFIRRFDILGENQYSFSKFHREGNFLRRAARRAGNIVQSSILAPYHTGDHYMQVVPYLALAHKITVYDACGNKSRVSDIYTTDKLGGLVTRDAIIGENDNYDSENGLINGIPSNLWFREQRGAHIWMILKDAERKIKNNNFTIDIDVLQYIKQYVGNDYFTDYSISTDEDSVNVGTKGVNRAKLLQDIDAAVEAITWGEMAETDFSSQAREIANRMHGIYNFKDMSALHNNLFGRVLLAMKGYALGMIERRFGQQHYVAALGDYSEGSFITLMKLWRSTFANRYFDMSDVDGTGIQELKRSWLRNTIMAMLMPWNKSVQHHLKQRGFDDGQIANLKRAAADSYMSLLMWNIRNIIGALLLGLAPSDDERKAQQLKNMKAYSLVDKNLTLKQLNDFLTWKRDGAKEDDKEDYYDALDQAIKDYLKLTGHKSLAEDFSAEYFLEGGWANHWAKTKETWDNNDISLGLIPKMYSALSSDLSNLNTSSQELVKRVNESEAIPLALLYYHFTRVAYEQAIFNPQTWAVIPNGFAEFKNLTTNVFPTVVSFISIMGDLIGDSVALWKDWSIGEGGNLEHGLWYNLKNHGIWLPNYEMRHKDVAKVADQFSRWQLYNYALDNVYKYAVVDEVLLQQLVEESNTVERYSEEWYEIVAQIAAMERVVTEYGFPEKRESYMKKKKELKKEAEKEKTVRKGRFIFKNKKNVNTEREIISDKRKQWIADCTKDGKEPPSVTKWIDNLSQGTEEEQKRAEYLKTYYYVKDDGTMITAGGPREMTNIEKYCPFMVTPYRPYWQYMQGGLKAIRNYDYSIEKTSGRW